MNVKILTLRNFKSIGDTPQTLRLRPLTLLYGPNSAGKSTILQSLMYLLEILQHGNCNPGTLSRLGSRNLGGFYSLVNGHDLSKAITITIGFDIGDSVVSDYCPYRESTDPELLCLQMQDISGELTQAELQFEIRWSSAIENAYVASYTVALNGRLLGKTESGSDGRQAAITRLNFQHPLLQHNLDEELIEEEVKVQNARRDMYDDFIDRLDVLNPAKLMLQDAIDEPMHTEDVMIAPLAFENFAGALPALGRSLVTALDGGESESKQDRFDKEAITTALTHAFVYPLDHLLSLLKDTIYIGPLREVPARNYKPDTSPFPERWINGLAAWDKLYSVDQGKLAEISSWFADSERFNAGYEIEREIVFELELTSMLYVALVRHMEELEDQEWVREQLDSLPEKTRLVFRELNSGIDLSPEDLGVGISQVLPIVVAALTKAHGLVAIEQPELHIHPAFQVELGSLFIEAIRKTNDESPTGLTFLLETHSEYLMLRLLRRIADTSAQELKPDDAPLSPDDISVCYAETTKDGLKLHTLRVNEEGDFIDRWPQGFFPERSKELF